MLKYYILVIFFCIYDSLSSQMVVEGDSLVGNEWIAFDQEYYKFKIEEDGIYRIDASQLSAAGLDLTQIDGRDFQLYKLGEQVPIYTSRLGKFREADFIEFYGTKNRGEMDIHHFPSEEDMLNPAYSMISDTSAYFLTWKDGSTNRRYLEIANNLTGSLPAPLPYYLHSEEYIYSDQLYKPTERGRDNIRYSTMVTAEGYASPITNNKQITIPADHIYRNVDEASFRIRFGINKVFHQIHLDFNNERYQEYNISNQYKVFNDTYSVPIGKIDENNTIDIEGQNGVGDKVIVSQVELTYPREFNFNDQSYFRFSLANTGFRRYLEIENFKSEDEAILLDLKNRTRRVVAREDNLMKVGVEPRNSEFDFILFDPTEEGLIKEITDLERIQFRDLSGINADFLVITSEKLFNDGNGNNYVQSYVDYRSSSEGGSFNPIVVTAEEIYDQFGYGIDRHFYGINNFAFFANREWSDLRFFFVIGKGIEYGSYRTLAQQQNQLTANYYVPAWGLPGSDNLLFARKGSNIAMKPIGRIAVTDPSEIKIYLDKIKRQEANQNLAQTMEDKYWTKKILHLAGGKNAGEQNVIGSYLASMENIIANEQFGADVTTFRKNSADPLQTATSSEIINEIDNGLSLITFFGHSSVGTFDFSIEDPAKYKNEARLPLILSLGCYSGNIFVPAKAKGLSEQFVFEPEVGAVAFAASSGPAYISAQGVLGQNLYEGLTDNFYGKTIGEAFQNMFNRIKGNTSIAYVTLLQQMTLHGDPAFSFIAHEGPDYMIDFSSIKTIPEVVSSADSRYEISMDLINLGNVINDSLTLALEHILPDGTISDTIYIKTKAPASKSQVNFVLFNRGTSSIGLNKIRVLVDSENNINELPSPIAEMNNGLKSSEGEDFFEFFIADNSARPVYPSEFSIVNDDEDIVLQASTSNAFTPLQNYIFELDTSGLFENPIETAVINSKGGVIEWKPETEWENNKVYYWRVSSEEENPLLGRLWGSSSFIYLVNSPEGWNQSHYNQYRRNELMGIIAEPGKTDFDVDLSEQRFDLGRGIPIVNGRGLWHYFNGNPIRATNPINFGSVFMVWIIYPKTFLFRNDENYKYGGLPTITNSFGYDFSLPGHIDGFKRLMEDVPEGARVFIYSITLEDDLTIEPQKWEEEELSAFTLFENLGSNTFQNFMNQDTMLPFLFVYDKNGGIIHDEIGTDPNSTIKTTIPAYITRNSGLIETVNIGPSQKWESLVWNYSTPDASTNTYLNVYGYTIDNIPTLLFENVLETELNLSSVDAEKYPYLKIEVTFTDSEYDYTSSNLNYLRVFYSPYPELIFDTNNSFTFYNDTINQGEQIKFSTQIRNLSRFSSDSLEVKYSFIDSENNRIDYFRRYESIEKDDPLIIEFNTSSESMEGSNQFSVELNPFKDKEKFYFNNLAIKNFLVRADNSNPLLNVVFDNQVIMDGDVVSSSPEIKISLIDDNNFFLLDDPELFEIKLDTGDINALMSINAADPSITFTPGDSNKNEAELIYKPTLKDGTYTLYAQARDKSGNFSGDNEYAITFKVVSKKTVSNVYNYPNPFSSRTQFVFDLTGEIPENFRISIMTLSGKIVKEIRNEEIGSLRIGTNRTEYWWDGTDEFGDKLANGVYLYKVDISTENEPYELNQIESNKAFFKDNFGKLVIIR